MYPPALALIALAMLLTSHLAEAQGAASPTPVPSASWLPSLSAAVRTGARIAIQRWMTMCCARFVGPFDREF